MKFCCSKPKKSTPLSHEDKQQLEQSVSFYQQLIPDEKTLFAQRVALFLETTNIVGHQVDVTRLDELLIAAGAIIPVWKFPKWHYFKLHTVYLVSAAFNEHSEFGQADSRIQGLVGTGHLTGKMILSQPALRHGFSNSKDKRNLAIHEFTHLIEIADGDLDGFPERLKEYAHCIPWLDLVRKETNKILSNRSNIRAYGATNPMEFFAVASEFFFERPGLLQRKHPEVYQALSDFYKQDLANIKHDIKPRKKALCPCGSGKRYKRCCMPIA